MKRSPLLSPLGEDWLRIVSLRLKQPVPNLSSPKGDRRGAFSFLLNNNSQQTELYINIYDSHNKNI